MRRVLYRRMKTSTILLILGVVAIEIICFEAGRAFERKNPAPEPVKVSDYIAPQRNSMLSANNSSKSSTFKF